jgi:hypothetical protein
MAGLANPRTFVGNRPFRFIGCPPKIGIAKGSVWGA